ncbi:hypothetical protein JCM30760_01070 [Thiomicrorhabdus hydrogeniphila]
MFSLITYCKRTLYAAHNLPKVFVLFVIAMSLSACQLFPTEEKIASNSGFGGTGKTVLEKPVQVAKNKSGFGGTGQIAKNSGFGGTGIIGTITEFGSIWVNGIEIEYPKNAKVNSNLMDNDSIQIGQQVMVETVIDKALPWTKNIEIFYPLAGKIDKVNSDHIVVDGKIIFTSKNTKISKGLKIAVGNYIAISGYPNLDKSWNATLLSNNPAKKHFEQDVPKIHFSNKVKKLYIQTTQSQLVNWNKQFSGLPINLIQTTGAASNANYLLTADIEKGHITRYKLQQYNKALGHHKNNLEKEKISSADN